MGSAIINAKMNQNHSLYGFYFCAHLETVLGLYWVPLVLLLGAHLGTQERAKMSHDLLNHFRRS